MGGLSRFLYPWCGRCVCGARVAVTIGTEGATITHVPPFCEDAGKVRSRGAALAFVARCKDKAKEGEAARERHKREGIG